MVYNNSTTIKHFAGGYFENELPEIIKEAYDYALEQSIRYSNIEYASGRHEKKDYFWDFLVVNMKLYESDKKIARIIEIEKELAEGEPSMPEQEHEELRQEYRSLLVKCFDEAICEKIDNTFPGGLAMEAYDLVL